MLPKVTEMRTIYTNVQDSEDTTWLVSDAHASPWNHSESDATTQSIIKTIGDEYSPLEHLSAAVSLKEFLDRTVDAAQSGTPGVLRSARES